MKTPITRFISIMILAIASCSASGQYDDTHGLSKYSYPLFALANSTQHTGTAFFYSTDDSTFLVSNYHAIKGMSPLKQTIAFQSDTIYLEYPSKHTGERKLLAVDVREQVVGKTEVFSMVDRIDLFKVPITLPGDADVHFINEMVDATLMDQQPEEIVVFGFPPGKGAVQKFYSRQEKLTGQVNENGFREYDASILRQFPNTSTDARAVVAATSRYYFFIRPYAQQGYSGAPVFGKYRTEDDQFVYRFAGVIFGGQPSTKQTWAIRPEVALAYLEK